MKTTDLGPRPSPHERPKERVDSKTVTGRRALHFASLDEAVADAEALVASPTTQTLGNWPPSQLLTHLATAINRSIDGMTVRLPWFFRLYGRLAKRRILRRGLPAGFQIPREREAGAYPPASSPQEALALFRKAVNRFRSAQVTTTHPLLGRLTHEEWTRFHLRHAELHLSFVVLS